MSRLFRVELDDYAAPGFYSGSKYYFGTMEQIHEWISAIEGDEELAPKFEKLCAAYHAYRAGDAEVTHPVAYREVPFLKPARLLRKEELRLNRHEWKHFNVWGCPYYLKCDFVDTTHLWLSIDQEYHRYVVARFHNLQYKNSVGEWRPLGKYWGFPEIIVEEDSITRNRLAEWEKTFKTQADAEDDWRNFQLLKDADFCELCNDIFGDG